MKYAGIITGIAFCIFGIMFSAGKVHIHMSEWKNLPDEEKQDIRIVPLCMNIGSMICAGGILFIVYGSCPALKPCWYAAGTVLWIIAALSDFLFIAKSKHYYKIR